MATSLDGLLRHDLEAASAGRIVVCGDSDAQNAFARFYTTVAPVLREYADLDEVPPVVFEETGGKADGVGGVSVAATTTTHPEDEDADKVQCSPSSLWSPPPLSQHHMTQTADGGGGNGLPVRAEPAEAPVAYMVPPLLPLKPPRPKRQYRPRSKGPRNPARNCPGIPAMRDATETHRSKNGIDKLTDGRPLPTDMQEELQRQLVLQEHIAARQDTVLAYKVISADVFGRDQPSGNKKRKRRRKAAAKHAQTAADGACGVSNDDDNNDDDDDRADGGGSGTNSFNICVTCRLPLFAGGKTGAISCEKCGYTLPTPAAMGPADWQRITLGATGSSYLPISHLNDHIERMEGIGCSHELVEAIRKRAEGYGWIGPRAERRKTAIVVSQRKVVQLLQDEGFSSSAYAYAPYVRYKIWGTPLYKLNPQQKLLVRRVYVMHRIAYFKLSEERGWGAKNGQPVQFLCHKIGELLGFVDWARQCSLYETTDHSNQAEMRWELVRAYWRWPYYPTPYV